MSTHGGDSFPGPNSLFGRVHRVSRSLVPSSRWFRSFVPSFRSLVPSSRSLVPYLQIHHIIPTGTKPSMSPIEPPPPTRAGGERTRRWGGGGGYMVDPPCFDPPPGCCANTMSDVHYCPLTSPWEWAAPGMNRRTDRYWEPASRYTAGLGVRRGY